MTLAGVVLALLPLLGTGVPPEAEEPGLAAALVSDDHCGTASCTLSALQRGAPVLLEAARKEDEDPKDISRLKEEHVFKAARRQLKKVHVMSEELSKVEKYANASYVMVKAALAPATQKKPSQTQVASSSSRRRRSSVKGSSYSMPPRQKRAQVALDKVQKSFDSVWKRIGRCSKLTSWTLNKIQNAEIGDYHEGQSDDGFLDEFAVLEAGEEETPVEADFDRQIRNIRTEIKDAKKDLKELSQRAILVRKQYEEQLAS